MTKLDLLNRASDLSSRRVPYVWATVVRAEKPTSAKPGDCAVILADGTIEGFVGGSCAESSVRTESLKALGKEKTTTLLITPGDGLAKYEVRPGEVSVSNPCLSGGTIEIFLEPALPQPLMLLLGKAPIASALAEIAPLVGFDVRELEVGSEIPDDADAVILASHGGDEEQCLQMAIAKGVRYIALVASHKRGSAVLSGLAIDGVPSKLVHTPAGLDIGAKTPGEVAVSIIAEVIASRPTTRESLDPVDSTFTQVPLSAIDLVCGMEVAIAQSSLHLDLDGESYYFCGTGCKKAFAANPQSYLDREP
ncbi:MAG: YHS domain-containing protein [Acidimicrobiaceae bacterium]|nr:YHS domain-containing protein [Acidimicrobiaceae bacterium]